MSTLHLQLDQPGEVRGSPSVTTSIPGAGPGPVTVTPDATGIVATGQVPAISQTGLQTISLTVIEISGSGSRLVNAGIPLQEAQLEAADIGDAALWLNTGSGLAEVSCYVENLAPHLDDSIRSLLVQWTGDPDNIVAAELRLGIAAVESRLTKTTVPQQPVATLMPSSAHMIACDILPFTAVPSASAHADYSDYNTLFADMGYHALTHAGSGGVDLGKYARAMWCFYWLVRNGPSVSNAATFFNIGCQTAARMYNDDPYAGNPEFGNIDLAGNALHYLFTGWTNSRTRIRQYASNWTAGSHYFGGGGRRAFHSLEAGMCAYLLDIDDDYTRAQHISHLVTLITALDAAWDSGDPCLPVPVPGLHNSNALEEPLPDPDPVLPYMNAMMHVGAMRCFKKLAGESSALDALRTPWETALRNACDVILNDADGYDDNGGDCWIYGCYIRNGTTGIRWTDGANLESWWDTVLTAQGGTDSNTIHSDGIFGSAIVGDVVYNRTRDAFDTIASVTSSDEVELTSGITGQTSGDTISFREYDYASQEFPYDEMDHWHCGFVNTMFWYGYDAATRASETAQAAEFKAAARSGMLTNITRWNTPGTDELWGRWRGGGYYVGGSSVDQVGVNAGLQFLAAQSEWMDEAA